MANQPSFFPRYIEKMKQANHIFPLKMLPVAVTVVNENNKHTT